MRSKWSLIRHNCVRKHFWSDPSALEEVTITPNCGRSRIWSDRSAFEEVMITPNCARSWLWSDPKCAGIRLWSDFSDQIDLWSDHFQTIVQTVVRSNFLPDPVISVWEHTGARSTGSDHKPIWVLTSTWEEVNCHSHRISAHKFLRFSIYAFQLLSLINLRPFQRVS